MEHSLSSPLCAPLMNSDELNNISVIYESDGWESAALEAMKTYGALLVLGAFSAEECHTARAAFGRDLKRALEASPRTKYTNIKDTTQPIPSQCKAQRKQLLETADEDVPGQWPAATPVGPPGKGMATTLGLAHGEFAWGVRLSKQLRRIYSLLHATPAEEMCVGLDQPFFTAGSVGADGQPTGNTENAFWMHADQNKHAGLSGVLPSFQGVAYINASDTEQSSTTVLQLRSHNDGTYETLMDDPVMKSSKGHFGKVEAMSGEEQRAVLLQRAHEQARRVPAPAGSVLLWDSRTLHQGWQGGNRLAMPVVWEPSDRRDSKALARKLAAAMAAVPTTHWASLGVWHPMVRLGRQRLPHPECIPHQPQASILPVGLPSSWALAGGVTAGADAAAAASAVSAASATVSDCKAFTQGQEAAEYLATLACNAVKRSSPVHVHRLRAAVAALRAGASSAEVPQAGRAVPSTAGEEEKGHTTVKASRAVIELLSPLLQPEVAAAM